MRPFALTDWILQYHVQPGLSLRPSVRCLRATKNTLLINSAGQP